MGTILKNKRTKSPKITKSAEGEDCELRTAYCNNNPLTVVLCHAPVDEDLGMSIKNHDWWAAYGCSSCHDFVDGKPVTKGICDQNWRDFDWSQPIHRTQKKLFQKGLIKLC